jgi:membrane-anchored protein YejM (alkaline phosphatase superfamily)
LESQEPVGRFAKFTDGVWRPVTDYSAGVPLYTTPPQRTWVGLTDEEAQWLYDNCRTPSNLIDMVEAKLKEKNT